MHSDYSEHRHDDLRLNQFAGGQKLNISTLNTVGGLIASFICYVHHPTRRNCHVIHSSGAQRDERKRSGQGMLAVVVIGEAAALLPTQHSRGDNLYKVPIRYTAQSFKVSVMQATAAK